MDEIDFSNADVREIDELLDREGLPDSTIIKALEALAARRYLGIVVRVVQREDVSDNVLINGIELLEKNGISIDIGFSLIFLLEREGLSEKVKEKVKSSFASALQNADDMEIVNYYFGIRNLLIRSWSDENVRTTVIEGMAERGGDLLIGEVLTFLKETKRPSDSVAAKVIEVLLDKGHEEIIKKALDRHILGKRLGRIAEDALRKRGNPLQGDGVASDVPKGMQGKGNSARCEKRKLRR